MSSVGDQVHEPEAIIAVVGPTASGKTTLAKEIAERIGGFVVSADARQIYKGMDIGTNKEPLTVRIDQEDIPGFGLDLVEPNESFTVTDFQAYVRTVFAHPPKEDLIPILAGGTGLWVQASTDGLQIPEVPPNPTLRATLEMRIQNEGLQKLTEELFAKDPALQGNIDTQNPRRVIRALEVIAATGKPFSAQKEMHLPSFQTLFLMPDVSAEELKARITIRAEHMIQEGLLEETARLRQMYTQDLPALSAIGYAEASACLDGVLPQKNLAAAIAQRTWQYARRQRTWWNKDERVHLVHNPDEAERLARTFLNNTKRFDVRVDPKP